MTEEPPAGLDAPPPAARRSAAAVAATALLLALAASVPLAVGAVGTGPLDAAALDGAVDARSVALTRAAVLVTEAGRPLLMAPLALAVGIWAWSHGRRGDAVFVVATMAGASALFAGLKHAFDRLRPPELTRLADETSESLPSGHATVSMAVIGSLVVLAWAGRSTAARVAMVTAAALWVGAVGASRVYLGVHWFTDVVAGWLLGAAWLAACAAARLRWARRAAERPPAPAG